MKSKKAYIFIILGVVIALSRGFFSKEYDQLLLIVGLALMMVGVYNISKSLPSKNEDDFKPPLVQQAENQSLSENEEEIKK